MYGRFLITQAMVDDNSQDYDDKMEKYYSKIDKQNSKIDNILEMIKNMMDHNNNLNQTARKYGFTKVPGSYHCGPIQQ